MFGFLLVVIFFAIIIFVVTVLDRLRKLERNSQHINVYLDELRQRIIELESGSTKKTAPKVDDSIRREEPKPQPVVSPLVVSAQQAEQFSTPPPTPQAQQLKKKSRLRAETPLENPDPHSGVQARTREELEVFIGGKLLNRIGSLALILGVGFFLKYAFDNNMISETVRVFIGAVAGIGCLFGAHQTHKKGFAIFAQGLVAAGISILYLSVYASFNFYHLIPQIPAFILMSFLTTITFAVAIRYNAFAVGILGWIGGFLTPIMLSTGIPNEAGFFTYLALLNVGMLGIVLYKPQWQLLEILSFAATWLYYLSWYFEYYTADAFAVTTFFVILFWILFYGTEVTRLQLALSANPRITQWLGAINAIVFSSTLYALVNEKYPSSSGVVLALCGIMYLGTQVYEYRTRNNTEASSQRLLLTSIALFFVAVGIHFTSYRIPFGWTLLSAVVVWAGVLWNLRSVRMSGQLILLITVLSLFSIPSITTYIPHEDFSLLLNWRTLTLASLIGCLSFTSWALRNQSAKELQIRRLNIYVAAAIGFWLLTVECNDFFRSIMHNQTGLIFTQTSYRRFIALASLWNVYGAGLLFAGIKKNQPQIIFSALAVLFIAIIMNVIEGIHVEPIELFSPVFNWRVFSLLWSVIIIVLCVRIFGQSSSLFLWKHIATSIMNIGIVILLFVLLTGETLDYFAQKITSAYKAEVSYTIITDLENQQQLFLSAIWLLYSVALMTAGIMRHNRNVRIVSMAVFAFTILKIFLYDLSFLETLYRIFSFIGLGVILLGVSYAYQKFKDIILEK